MNVLSTINVSRDGNDCLIKESYSLVECFGVYSVIRFFRACGWDTKEDVSILIATTNQKEAGREYKKYCKYYKV